MVQVVVVGMGVPVPATEVLVGGAVVPVLDGIAVPVLEGATVLVGGTGVFVVVGGTTVLVGGTGVFVGGTAVGVQAAITLMVPFMPACRVQVYGYEPSVLN